MSTAGRRLMLPLIGLLLCASTASAECTWVLSMDVMQTNTPESTFPTGAYQTKAECEAAISEKSQNIRSWTVTRHALFNLYCLPDTVDPRK